MENYKSKIINLIETNKLFDGRVEFLYKQFYTDMLNHIKLNEGDLENDIIKKYTNMQIFYINHNNLFIMCYNDEIEFRILNEDELICYISKDINTSVFTIEKKHSLISKIIHYIKNGNINDIIPESKTIQNVLDIFNTIFYNNKDLCKYILIIIGELFEKNKHDYIYIVSEDLKQLITDILDFAYSYFKIRSTSLDNFKIKHNCKQLDKCLIIPCNSYKKIYGDLIKNNIISIILVSIYYKNRFKSSHLFLEHHFNVDHIKQHILFFKDKTIDTIIGEFNKDYLEDSGVLKMSQSELHYLWKDYCIHLKIPNVVSFNVLMSHYSSDSIYKTSKRLEYVSEFVSFWKEEIIYDDTESEFEISELQQLLKYKKNMAISEKKLINLLSHFYKIEIENDKYITNIRCSSFNKRQTLDSFKKSNVYDDSISINTLYKKYIEWESNNMIISKNYFIKYISD